MNRNYTVYTVHYHYIPLIPLIFFFAQFHTQSWPFVVPLFDVVDVSAEALAEAPVEVEIAMVVAVAELFWDKHFDKQVERQLYFLQLQFCAL